MGKTQKIARKALAVFSAAALLMSCGATGFVTSFGNAGITANAASSSVATQLKILDENGNDLGDNPIIYLDNSEAAGQDSVYHNIKRSFRVVASNDNGVSVDDEIRFFQDGDAEDYLEINCPEKGKEEIKATIAGGHLESPDDKDPYWVAKKSGTTHLYFTTNSGEVYRKLTVVVYQPGTDLRIAQGSKGTNLDLNDYNLTNSTSLMVIANHQYQFTPTKVPANSTDEVEWFVYEGADYEGSGTPKATSKAEITQKGLFTPKKNGNVTIVAKYKATETTPRDYSIGSKKIKVVEDGKEKDKTVQYVNVPKYIHVVIVKENPATSLKITNNPGALEVGDTIQLASEATPSYYGAGYETGATDEFTWKSSNTKVATVDAKGLVTAVGKGDVKITVTGENENVRAEIDLKVLTKADSISFQSQTMSTRVGVETPVTAIMNPSTADEEIEWFSSDDSIATVRSIVEGAFSNEQTAVVMGVKVGTVTITARAKNSGVEKKITCTVKKKVNAADIKLSTTNGTEITTIYNGTTLRVFDQKSIVIDGALVAADGASPDDTIEWQVLGNGANNGDYVTIDKITSTSIKLTGFARGTVTVKASSKNDPSLSKSFSLQVLKKATRGTIIDNETGTNTFHKNLNVGSTISLGADIKIESNYPYDHDDRVAHWKSSDPSVVEIDDTGFARILGNGKATITMITESGYTLSTSLTGFTTSSIMIKGLTAGTAGSLPKTSIGIDKNLTGTKALSATVRNEKDASVSDVAVEWSTDDPSIATVDENGKVTAHNIGDAIITARSGNKSDSCIVECNYDLKNATITVKDAVFTPYTDIYEPEVIISEVYTLVDMFGGSETVTIELKEGVDYTLEYSNNTKVGQTGKVVITGLGHYASVVNKTFKIVAQPLNDNTEITLDPIDSVELTMDNKSAGAKAPVTIYHRGYQLQEDVDYTLSYASNKAPGVATVTINGKGNYSGRTTGTYEVFCKHGKETESVKKKATCQEKGLAQVKCDICGHISEKVLPITGHDFRQTKVVAPTYDEDGYTLYTCSVCKTTEKRDPKPALKRVNVSKCTITLSAVSFNENGSVQIPKVTVKNGSTTLKENTDYTLTYSNKSSKTAGSYTVKVVGKNGYTGTVTKTYKIVAAAKSIKLDKTSMSLGVNESITLKATTDPASASSSVTWTSSNTSIATVSGGKVTAKKAGTATITATAGKVKATCTITVKNAPNSVSLSNTSITIGVGETWSLSANIPANTAAATRTYSSSDSSVVKMTKTNWTGEFKGMKVGTAKVIVKLYNGKTATCTVNVKAAPTSVSLNSTAITLGVGETYSLSASIPWNAGAAKRTYSSSNSSVVKMTKTNWTGEFKAMKAGTAKVTVKLYNGKTASCTITVKAAPSWVKLNKGNMTLKVGQKSSVAAVLPYNTGAAKRTYRTSNSSIVQMTKTNWTGEFVAKKVGTAYVTVRLYNGKEASIKVTVVK